MKILFVDIQVHPKNQNALLQYNIITHVVQNLEHLSRIDFGNFDIVISPTIPIRAEWFPNTIFIFGPHFSVFPDTLTESSIECIRSKNAIYIQPSEWAAQVWKLFPVCSNVNIMSLPFGVDTETFNEISNRPKYKIFVYFKRRSVEELEYLKQFLNSNDIEYRLFEYGYYKEEEYLDYLQQAKYGIWLGCHESQGFALEEALSCNVPLLVWNVSSMSQEAGQSYPNYSATSIPYWDKKCGEYFYSKEELEDTFETFQRNLRAYVYQPRAFILRELSFRVCKDRIMICIELLKQNILRL